MGLLHTDLLLHECNDGPSPTGGIIYSEPDKGGGRNEAEYSSHQAGRKVSEGQAGKGTRGGGKVADKRK